VANVYFRQLLSGRDFAVEDSMAAQMVNFVYLVGDRDSGDAVVVDPAYAVAELVDVLEADGMHLRGVLATHHHPDHVGGSMMGHGIEGIDRLLAIHDVPVHVNRNEAELVTKVTGVGSAQLVAHDGGDVLEVGGLRLTMIHTPGHTPGSQCFLFEGMLVAGDTLFLQGCGRTDLPGSDPEAMFHSLRTLAELPDETALFPGHRYSPPSSAVMGAVKEMNPVMRFPDKEQWLAAWN
jgi:glyoxylase-like metal-dependent hydrolase (beta-lactamase superfamily II)